MEMFSHVEDDWDFSHLNQSQRQYGVHFFHHYTAKFIPQIPSKIIINFGNIEDLIVDPFMGCGTTLIEAKTLGFNSIGLDTNPLAVKISKAKTLILNKENTKDIDEFLFWIQSERKNKQKNGELLDNKGIDSFLDTWFRRDVANKIISILKKTHEYSPEIENFLQIGLSTLLKGMSNARMDSVTPILPRTPVYIDKKHYCREVNNLTRNIPVYERLYNQIQRMKNALIKFNNCSNNSLICNPIQGDARELSKFVKKCQLVVTSPPYWSAQNYAKIHLLSFHLFNMKTEDGKEIGRRMSTYLDEMKEVFYQVALILDGYFALVIGEDKERKMHEKILFIAEELGFKLIKVISRNISNQVSRAKIINKEFIYIFKH